MALSNIRKEPRREITEQLIGIALFAIVLVPDYYLGRSLHAQALIDYPNNAIPISIGMFFGLFIIAFGFVVLVLGIIVIHWFGERVCDGLALMGIDPRPKRRYQ